jgi:hypothetical protein
VADPGTAISHATSAVSGAVGGALSSTVNRVTSAWESGDFHALGRVTGEAAGTIATVVVPVGCVLGMAGRVARFARLGEDLGRVGGVVRDAGATLRNVASEIRGRAAPPHSAWRNGGSGAPQSLAEGSSVRPLVCLGASRRPWNVRGSPTPTSLARLPSRQPRRLSGHASGVATK